MFKGRRAILAVVALALAVGANGQTVLRLGSHNAPRATFPISAHASGRYLVGANGVPFPILGRVTWMLSWTHPDDYTRVLDDTVAQGFNTIEVKPPTIPEGFQWDNGGLARGGVLPFVNSLDATPWLGQVIPYADIDNDAPDMTTPNEVFWSRVDRFFAAAEARGLLVKFFPAYVGFHNTDWWMEMMVANGPTKMEAYGEWVATRYASQANLVWMFGGDKGTGGTPFSMEEAEVLEAFMDGIESVTRVSALQSCEWLRESICTDLYPTRISVNGVYTGATTLNSHAARAWAIDPPKPAYAQEFPFETAASPDNERRFAAWAWLATKNGYLWGVHALFEPPDVLVNLATSGTSDVARLNALIKSLRWWLLEPANAIITAGAGTANTDDQVVAARDPGGELAVVYRPPAHSGTFTINMAGFARPVTARWFDITDGTYTDDSSGISNSGTHVFTAPGTNDEGDTDWLLVLTC